MTPDWNAIRLDLLDIDAPMRATLREMRPFFAKALPGILARFYDKVRQHDRSSGIFQNGAMQEAIRLQLQHWDLIGAAEFSLPYFSSVARLSEIHQRAGVAPPLSIIFRLVATASGNSPFNSCASRMHICVHPKFGRKLTVRRHCSMAWS